MSGTQHKDRYWLSNITFEAMPKLIGTHRTDVTIIGAGITGLSAAYHLKKNDPALHVTLIDKSTAGSGSSGCNAGFLRDAFGWSFRYTRLRFGEVNARLAYNFAERARDDLAGFIRDESLECDFEYNRLLRFASHHRSISKVATEVEQAEALGLSDRTIVSDTVLEDQIDSPLIYAGYKEPKVGVIHPLKFVCELRNKVLESGVQLHENTPARQVHSTKPIRIETPEAEILTKKVIFATNAFSEQMDRIRRLQTPAFTYAILTRKIPVEELQELGLNRWAGMMDLQRFPFYVRRTPDNRLLVGGGNIELPGDKTVYRRGNKYLQAISRFLGELFPSIKYIDIEEKWKGRISIPLDMMPLIGADKDERFLYSLGYMGAGIPLAFLSGQILTDLVLEKETSLTKLFFVNRFPLPWFTEPVRTGIGRTLRSGLLLQERFADWRS